MGEGGLTLDPPHQLPLEMRFYQYLSIAIKNFRLKEWPSIGVDKSRLLIFLLIFHILWQKVNKMLFCEQN